MSKPEGIQWTNRSVLQLAKDEDPIATIERRARELVLQARDAGWQGPPFNPIAIADLLKIPVEANADTVDALTIATEAGLRIQFNPTQARERVRFSIAHEIAHTLFPDVADAVRHRSGPTSGDDWQLEMLCNIAAAEFVMPIGSLEARERLPSIEQLMVERRRFDVSAEAFLIRVTKSADEPIVMFCASPLSTNGSITGYRVDYTVGSKSAPLFRLSGTTVPKGSAVYSCTAIGYTDKQVEHWLSQDGLTVECVGIPGYPGSTYPRVCGLIRFEESQANRELMRFVHGDVLDPRNAGMSVICQMVNDQARTWGGGVSRNAARKYPTAHHDFAAWIISIPRANRLGKVHFAQVGKSIFLASLVSQAGFGPSPSPRIRYAALEQCLECVSEFASERSATVHMPRIGAGESGGSWDTVEEIVRDTIVGAGVSVTVYDLPPKRMQNNPGLFD